MLSELDNRDKHRNLLLMRYASNELDVAWGGELDMPRPTVNVVEEEFENGDTIVTSAAPPLKPRTSDPMSVISSSPRPGSPGEPYTASLSYADRDGKWSFFYFS